MPPKRRKCFKKEKSPKEYLPSQNYPKGRKMNKARPRRVQAKNVPLYFCDTHFYSSSASAEFDESTSENESEESFSKELMKKKTLKCPDCEYTTTLRTSLARHMSTHSNMRSFNCSICDRSFKTKTILNKHKHCHSNVKPYLCNDCNSTYRNSSELIRHIRYKHTHERPFKCTECNFAFVERSKLVRHMSNHTESRLHQCPDCSYASFDTQKLLTHLRKHTIKKLYKCKICGSNYTQSDNLQTHMQQMHSVTQMSKYSCMLCSLRFSHSSDLQTHMQNLHVNLELCEDGGQILDKSPPAINKTYECNDCGLTFAQIHNLIDHIMVCDKKPGHKRKVPEQEQTIPDSVEEQDSKKSSIELTTISNYLIRGEVILLPAMDTDKYIMIQVVSDENDANQQTAVQDLGCTVKKEVINNYEEEFEWNDSKVNSQKDFNIIDEEIEPFFGFDLKDIQSATKAAHQLNIQTCF